jgi:hypothetical protein
MTKDEQKNYTTPTKKEEKDEEKMTEPEEQELHSIASNKTVEAPPPVKPDITVITARLDAAVKAYTPVNRSSDLVPLNHDYDIMRKTLRTLIGATKQYKLKRGEMDKARMEVRTVVQYAPERSKGSHDGFVRGSICVRIVSKSIF